MDTKQKLEEIDLLRLQAVEEKYRRTLEQQVRIRLEQQEMKRDMESAMNARNAVIEHIRTTYDLADTDQIDLTTGAITRVVAKPV